MLQGLNHLTLAVANLDNSLSFYRDILQLEPQARWDDGAYLSCGWLWLCLSHDEARHYVPAENSDYTHYAFTISKADFAHFSGRLQNAGVKVWKKNSSEGESFYFLDPDGHKLEIHVGTLAERLASCRLAPYKNMVFFNT